MVGSNRTLTVVKSSALSRWAGRHEECPHCSITYENFKSGYTYSDIRMLLWVGDPDYNKWKYKRRHTVLGLWHQIKKSLWEEHLYLCEMFDLAKKEAKLDEEMVEKLPEEKAELDAVMMAYEESLKRADSTSDVPF